MKNFPGLITQAVRAQLERNKKHYENGCVSDPVDIPMYREYKLPNGSFTIFKCVRGTSALEAFHRYLAAAFKTKSLSPELFGFMISSIVHRWNWDRGVACGKNQDYGMYDIELLQKIKLLYLNNECRFESDPLPDFTPFKDVVSDELFGFEWFQHLNTSSKKEGDDEDDETDEDLEDGQLGSLSFSDSEDSDDDMSSSLIKELGEKAALFDSTEPLEKEDLNLPLCVKI